MQQGNGDERAGVGGQGSGVPPVRPEDLGIGRLFGAVRDAVIVAEADSGRIVLWNPAAEEIFGYSPSEALGLKIDALFPERFEARDWAGMTRDRETGPGSY